MVFSALETLEDPSVLKIKQWCLKKGNDGLRRLVRELRYAEAQDSSRDRVSVPTFVKVLASFGARLTDIEVKHLTTAFAEPGKPGVAFLSTPRFAAALVAGLPARRRA
eukprot:RCo020786